ncbi:MAG TPA: hypothetical protein VIL88_17805 [Devosia sp.]|jgi:chromosome segregation ATPase|uniref:hypothetical protein n=1 Tax=Devosia sp. TaxID=1871048 RepID=UPI002F93EAD3
MNKTTSTKKPRPSRSKAAIAARAAAKGETVVLTAEQSAEIEDAAARIEKLTNIADAKQVRIEVLEGSVTTLEDKVKGLEAALEESRDGVTLYSEKAKQLQADLNHQGQLYNDLKARYDELMPALEIAQEKAALADDALAKIAELQSDAAKMQSRFDVTLANANRLGAEVHSLEKNLRQSKANAESLAAEDMKTLEELTATKQELTKVRDELIKTKLSNDRLVSQNTLLTTRGFWARLFNR